uniref:SCP domain-containing protein n=1 Tax=Neolamprologus brichardi TaxID=32507 RepID=A0A3Q4HB27_NEOBR
VGKYESFKKEFLDTHNAYRAQHGAPPLTFNTELDDAAQKWANQMLAKKKLGHSNTNDGENKKQEAGRKQGGKRAQLRSLCMK